jgi:hypothetical protein
METFQREIMNSNDMRTFVGQSNNQWNEAGLPFLKRLNICYEPSVSDTSKMRGFDFNIFTWDT